MLYDKMSERRPVWKDEFRQTDMCLDRRPTSCLLLAFYEQVTERLDLHCFLCQSAAVTTADRQTVSHERAFDAPLFAHLSTNLGTEDEVCDRNELKEAAHKAILVDGLSNASLRVARSDVGYDADSAIVEATEQTVLKLCPRHRSLVRSRSLGT